MSVTLHKGSKGVWYADGASMSFMPTSSRVPAPTRPVRNIFDYNGEYLPWDHDNLHPQRVVQEIMTSDVLPAVIKFKCDAVTSGGLMYGDHTTDENGMELYRPINAPEIEDFKEAVEIDNYFRESSKDTFSFHNDFPEMRKNVAGKIVGLQCVDATLCRLGVPPRSGRKKGIIEQVYVNDWEYSYSSSDAEIIKAIDPYERVVDQIRACKDYKFIIPRREQSYGQLDYAKGSIDALLASGWLGLSKSIPAWKNQVMQDQFSIKVIVEVAATYWDEKYPGFKELSENEQDEIQSRDYKAFADYFKGTKAAGNTLFTQYHPETAATKEWSEWKVTILNTNKWGEGSYIEDSAQSDAHIIRSQGVDQTLIGYTPGKGFSPGSGSDKRVAFNQFVLLSQPDQRRILRPLDYIAEINGWNKRYGREGRRVKFWFKNTFIATLDHGKDTKEANSNDNSKT